MSTRGRPVAALLVAAALFGAATTGTKLGLRGLGPLTLLALALVSAAVVLWVGVAVRGFHRPAQPGRVVLLGLFEPALADLGQTLGLTRTTASNAALICGLECVFVVLLALVFLHERVSRGVAVAVVVAGLGLAVLETGSGALAGPGLGDGLVLLGALSAAAYTILARGLHPDDDPLSVTAVQFTAASAGAVPVALTAWVRGAEPLPVHADPAYLVVAALVGVFGYAASFVLFNFAITKVEAAPAAVVVNLIPAFGLTFAVVGLGERLSGAAAAGAGLICLSVGIFAALEIRESRSPATGPVVILPSLVPSLVPTHTVATHTVATDPPTFVVLAPTLVVLPTRRQPALAGTAGSAGRSSSGSRRSPATPRPPAPTTARARHR